MEPFLDFQEVVNGDSEENSSSSSNGFRLVPWLNWKEWESVRESLFSSSAEKIVFALKRVSGRFYLFPSSEKWLLSSIDDIIFLVADIDMEKQRMPTYCYRCNSFYY